MKLRKKHVFIILAICILGAFFYAYKEYNRKPADLLSVKPIANIDATNLLTIYASDEQKANALYLGKPIDVTGVISEIQNQQDTLVNVMLGKADDMHRVSCLLDQQNLKQIRKYKQGNTITLRGICTGYLMDVELNRCVVIR